MKRLLHTCLLVCCMLIGAATYAQITGPQQVCLNTTAYYSRGAGYSLWSVTGGNALVTTPSGTAQILWSNTGVFTITSVFFDDTNNLDTLTYTVTVYALPTPEIIPQNINNCVTIPPAIVVGSPRRGPEDDLCYTVCDSGWYYYNVKGTSGSTYQWSTSANGTIVPLNANGDSVRVRWYGEGYTTLTVEETTINGCIATKDICIKVIALPTACVTSAPADTNGVIKLCLGANLSLNSGCSQTPSGSDVVARTWIMGDGKVYSNESYVNHIYAASGTYTVKLVVESNCGCTDTIVRTVMVHSSPGPDIYCVNTVCHNDSTILTTSSSCTSLVWNVTGEDSSRVTGDSIIIYWGNGANGYGVVSLLADCEGGCPYPTEVYVPILPDTTVVSGDAVVCNGETSVYTVPFIPATIYSWCNPIVDSPCLVLTGIHTNEMAWTWGAVGTPPMIDIYKVRVVYTNPFLGCSGYAELPITVAGEFTLQGDTVICEGANSIINTFAPDGTGLNCNWTLYQQGTDAVVYTASNVGTVTLTSLAAGTYKLVVNSVSPYLCNNPEIVSIRVTAAPAAPAGPTLGPDTVCANSLVSYFTTAAAPGTYLEWEASAGTPNTGVGQQFNTMWTGTLPATLKLRHVLLSEPGCVSPWLTKNIYPVVVEIDGIVGRDTVCANDTVSYSLPTVADRYTWTLSDPSLGSVIYGQYTKDIVIQWNHYTGSPVKVDLTVQIERCGQTIDTILEVLLKPYATATVQADVAPFCSGEEVLFTVSSGSSYAWTFGDGTSATRALDTATHQYADSGTFFAKVVVQHPYGCSSPATVGIMVNVLPGPVALLSTEDEIGHCGHATWDVGLQTTLQQVPGATYTYTLMHNGVAKPAAGAGPNFSVDETDYGTGSYTVLVSNGGCSRQTNAITISDDCTPSTCTPAHDIDFSIDDVDCGTVDVSAIFSSPATFTQFNFGEPGSSTNVVATTTASHTYKRAGHYTITINGKDGNNCNISERHVVTVPLVADFMVQYACSSNVMKVTLIDLSTFIGNDIDNWKWYIDGTPTYACNTQACSPTLSAGTHTIKLVVDNGGGQVCETTKMVDVPVTATASFNSIDEVCETQAVHFFSTSTGDIVSYLWGHGDGTGSVLENTSRDYEVNVSMPFYSYNFPASLQVTDIYGCASTYSESILVYDNQFDGLGITTAPSAIVGCSGESESLAITISSDPGNYPYTYLWNSGASGTFTNFPFAYNVTSTGEFNVTVTDKYGCQIVGQKVSAYFEEINAAFTGDTIFCAGEKMNLSIFAGHQYSYQWLVKDAGSSTIYEYGAPTYPYLVNDVMNTNPSIGAVYDGATFWGVVTSVNGCTDTVGPITVHQYNTVSSNISYTLSAMPPCLNNGPVTLTLSSPNANGFVWSNGIYGNTITFTSPGTYYLQMIDSNGCYKDPSQFKIPGGPDFSQLITGCYTRCMGQPTTLYGPLAPTGHTYTYQWLRDGNILVGTTQNVDVTVSGSYTLVISDTEGSFVCTDTSKVIDIDFVACPNSYCAEDTSISCISCFYDATHNARIMELVINFDYNGSETPYSVTCTTAEIYDPQNFHGGSYIGANVRPGANKIRIDVADTSPFQTNHTIIVAIGDCYIPINLTTPTQCAGND